MTVSRVPARDVSLWVAILLLALFIASQYGDALDVPFINDDYIFLDKTRDATFGSLWEPRRLPFHWYRPWSRELHYWTLQRLFGLRELPFHLASLALGLAVLAGYWVLVRRLAGARVAAVATAGWAALAAWAVPLVWVAGVQDLWMMVFAIGCLLGQVAGRRWWSACALPPALLSKESAAVLPALAVAYQVLIAHQGLQDALRRTAPLWAVTLVWALFHPVLGGRLRQPIEDPLEPGVHSPVLGVIARTLGVPLNLDVWPGPESGWSAALARSLPGAALLAVMVLWGARAGRERPQPASNAPGRRRLLAFGGCWALVGWAPMLMPTLGWHAYYALLGAAGVWLAVAVTLARRPVAAAAVVVALGLLRGARADTPSLDWGSEWYQRRAASFIRFMRADLLSKQPRVPPHSRLYFVRVPSNVGFLAGEGPAVRIWYGDRTLRGGFYPSYRQRGPVDPAGDDLFFRFDTATGWVPVRRGPEDVATARRANPRWVVDHEVLAQTLARGGDWGAAAAEYVKLAGADSVKVDFAYNAGICFEALGDSARAAVWYARAALLPGADAEVRAAARRFAREPPGRRTR